MIEQNFARRRDGGFTMMELMVTMTIAASLMGLGVGVFLSMGKRTAADNALESVSGLIVNVRNASSRFPAMLFVDPEGETVQGLAQEVMQELHFDPRAVDGGQTIVENGIEGRECQFGAAAVEPSAGRVGGALRLAGSQVNCGNFAAYDVTDGLTVELWMKPDSAAGGDLCNKGDALRVRLESGGRVSASIGVLAEHGVEKVVNTAQIPPVRPNQWMGVRVTYDRSTLSIFTDQGFGWTPRGVPKAETRRLTRATDASLTVGGFSGLLDDFRFAGVHATEPIHMPPGVTLVGNKPDMIHFVGGRLDPAVHLGAKTVSMEYLGKRKTLEIATNGMLNISYSEASAPLPEKRPDQPAPPKKE